jgi:tricorn protease-like protein
VIVQVGTGAITPLTTMGDVFTPHWVRDGQAIAFFKAAGIGLQRYDVYDLYVLDLLTQQEHRLVANLGTLPPLTISPDGTQLAYPNAPAPGLIVLDIATGAREDILTTPCLDTTRHPVWSPDGRYLAFVAEMRGSYNNGQVYMVDVHNHTVVQVTNFAEKASVGMLGRPTWAPDSTALAIATREHIVVAPIDSSQFIPVRCP